MWLILLLKTFISYFDRLMCIISHINHLELDKVENTILWQPIEGTLSSKRMAEVEISIYVFDCLLVTCAGCTPRL